MSFRITGTGSCAPTTSRITHFFEKLVDTSDAWINENRNQKGIY